MGVVGWMGMSRPVGMDRRACRTARPRPLGAGGCRRGSRWVTAGGTLMRSGAPDTGAGGSGLGANRSTRQCGPPGRWCGRGQDRRHHQRPCRRARAGGALADERAGPVEGGGRWEAGVGAGGLGRRIAGGGAQGPERRKSARRGAQADAGIIRGARGDLRSRASDPGAPAGSGPQRDRRLRAAEAPAVERRGRAAPPSRRIARSRRSWGKGDDPAAVRPLAGQTAPSAVPPRRHGRANGPECRAAMAATRLGSQAAGTASGRRQTWSRTA